MDLKQLLQRKKICAYCSTVLDTKWIWQGRFEFCYELKHNGTLSFFPTLEWYINWKSKTCNCKPHL